MCVVSKETYRNGNLQVETKNNVLGGYSSANSWNIYLLQIEETPSLSILANDHDTPTGKIH